MLLKKVRLGDLLVDNKVITSKQLDDALKEQKTNRQRLGKLLVNLGYVEEKQLLQLLAEQLNIKFIDLVGFKIDAKAVKNLNEMTARRLRALVIDEKPDHFLVVMADPTDLAKYDQLQESLSKPLEICVAIESEIIANIDNFYRSGDEIFDLAGALEDDLTEESFGLPSLNENVSNDEAPVAKFLQGLFEQAIQIKASDIHIEPDAQVLRVRMRVDGQLQEQVIKESRIVAALVLRLKLMCGLDISEKRIPQDGRFRIRAKNHDVDIRLSTMPIQHGESVVMRLLDQSAGLLKLEHTGIEAKLLREVRTLLSFPHGLILVTGPTGSGKTTTLYAALSELNEPKKRSLLSKILLSINCRELIKYRLIPKLTCRLQKYYVLFFVKILTLF